MIPNIEVKNRIQAKCDSYKKDIGTVAIISIRTPGDKKNTFATTGNIREILHLSFHDVGCRDLTGSKMTEKDAMKVAQFVDRQLKKHTQNIWVHCDAGISRSAGVAGAILKFLTGNDEEIFDNPQYIPNLHCYSVTLNALELWMKDWKKKGDDK